MLDIKDAFLAQDALAVVVALVGPPLLRHAERQMTDRDLLIVQLVITFLRNLIIIPDSSGTSGVTPGHSHCVKNTTPPMKGVKQEGNECRVKRQPQECNAWEASKSAVCGQRA